MSTQCDKCSEKSIVNYQASLRKYDLSPENKYKQDNEWDFWNYANEPTGEHNMHACAKHDPIQGCHDCGEFHSAGETCSPEDVEETD